MRALLLAALAGLQVACAAPARHEFRRPLMGTEFRLVLYAEDAQRAEALAGEVWGRLEELEGILSDYDRSSELSLLPGRSQEVGWVELSADLAAVLDHAQEVSRDTGGAFDVTVGPAVRHWRRARRRERAPGEEELQDALRASGHEALELDLPGRRARTLLPGMRLDLGGLAKGYALDEALALLRGAGVTAALVEGGGDVRVGAAPPGRRAWRVELEGGGVLALVDAAVATSGDLHQFVELEGQRRSHILDPASGEALADAALVSVVAPTGLEADAAATAASVLGPQAGLGWIEGRARLEARFLVAQKDGRRPCESSGWGRMMESARQDPHARSPDPE